MQTAKQDCLNEYYNSKLGKVIDFGSILGVAPGWSPNATKNVKELATLGVLKYVGVAGTAAAANKFNVTTIQTLNTTTTLASSAGAGLSTALRWLGRAAMVATVYSTGFDVIAHAACDTQARSEAGQITPIYSFTP